MQQKMNSIINKIEEYSKIIILRHKRPDGDALGAAYGLRAILKETYPDKKIWSGPTNHSPFQSLHCLLLQINFFLL